jgi:hypothetical protein
MSGYPDIGIHDLAYCLYIVVLTSSLYKRNGTASLLAGLEVHSAQIRA